MLRCREQFTGTGLSLEALGQKMGYPQSTARKCAWQFLQRTNDPRMSMLRKFAAAVGVSMAELCAEPSAADGAVKSPPKKKRAAR